MSHTPGPSMTDLTIRTDDGADHATTIVESRPHGGRPSSLNAHTIAHILDQMGETARVTTITIHHHEHTGNNTGKGHHR